VEVTVMTAIKHILECNLLNIILSQEEGQSWIIISPGALEQIARIRDLYITKAGYVESELTDGDLELAEVYLQTFNKDSITGKVIDNVLQPADPEHFEIILDALKEVVGSPFFSVGLVLPVVLLSNLFLELKGFYR
jgi:hypothetical protein